MKPGDMIEWVYSSTGNLVVHDENCFSSTMKSWIPIDGQMLLISIVDQTIYFLRKEGLFHAHVDETDPVGAPGARTVVSRARG